MVLRRLAMSSLFHNKSKDTSSSRSPPPKPPAAPTRAWPPSCSHPRTQSFCSAAAPGTRTVASIFLDSGETSFTTSSAWLDCSDSLSTASEESAGNAVLPGLRSSDRLLFDPGASATSSILQEKSEVAGEDFVGGMAVAFESTDPYLDFRASMAEMVAAHGVGGWGWLEEMLGWYLRANSEDTHSAVVAAFVDVIVAIADPANGSCSSLSSSCTFEEMELEVPDEARAC